MIPPPEIYILDLWAWFCYGFGWPGLHICWCMIRHYLTFPTCHTFDDILGHISAFDRDLQIPTGLHDHPQLQDAHRVDDLASFCHESLFDLLSGHFIRLTLFDVSVIFGWNRLRLMVFHIIILSSTCQIFYASPSSYSRLIRTDWVHLMPYWGIFSPLVTEMIVLSQICYSFHHLAKRHCICLNNHYSFDFHRGKLSVGQDVRVVTASLSMILQQMVILRSRGSPCQIAFLETP